MKNTPVCAKLGANANPRRPFSPPKSTWSRMSRNTVAAASPSRKVRMRPGCSSTYHRPSAAWNAPVIELNASPFIARASLTCGIAATVGTGVGAGVGGGLAVGVAVGDGDGVGLGVAVAGAEGGAVTCEASEGDAPIVGVGTVAGEEHAHAGAKVAASASRRAPMTVTVSTRFGQLRYARG